MTDRKRTGDLLTDAAQDARENPIADICTRCKHCNCTEIERLTAERDLYKTRAERSYKLAESCEATLRAIAEGNDK